MKKTGIVLAVAAVSILALWLIAGALLIHPIREAHTGFLFGQIQMELTNDLRTALLPPDQNEQWQPVSPSQAHLLADALRSNRLIDWNSCSLDGDIILDGWGRACILEGRSTPAAALRFTSFGKDGIRGTDDDIVREITQSKSGDAKPSPGTYSSKAADGLTGNAQE